MFLAQISLFSITQHYQILPSSLRDSPSRNVIKNPFFPRTGRKKKENKTNLVYIEDTYNVTLWTVIRSNSSKTCKNRNFNVQFTQDGTRIWAQIYDQILWTKIYKSTAFITFFTIWFCFILSHIRSFNTPLLKIMVNSQNSTWVCLRFL